MVEKIYRIAAIANISMCGRRNSYAAVCFLVLFLHPLQAWGATYYMRADGSAVNKGAATGPCGAVGATMNVPMHNRETFAAGDTIYLCDDGGEYRAQINMTSSGSYGSPITYRAAPGDSPVINGSDIISTWTEVRAHVWQSTVTNQSTTVFFNNTLGFQAADLASVDAEYEWFWDSNVLYVYSASDPDLLYTSPGVESSYRAGISNTGGRDYITIDGLTMTKGLYGIFVLDGATNFTVQNSTMSWNTYDGVRVQGSGSTSPKFDNNIAHDNSRFGIAVDSASGATITNNTTYNQNKGDYDTGISVAYGATGYLIDSNTSYNNFYQIKVITHADNGRISNNIVHGSATNVCLDVDDDSDNVIIENNTVYDCCKHGIHVELGSDNATIRYNKVYNAGTSATHSGIFMQDGTDHQVYYNQIYGGWNGITMYNGVTGATIYNNTIYNVGNDGIVVQTNSTGASIKNNIVEEPAGYLVRLTDDASKSGVSIDYNLYYDSASARWDWGTDRDDTTLADWKSATSDEAHSKFADPMMTNPANADFTLKSTSPAVNAGANVGLTRDHVRNAVPYGSAPDIGAYEFRSINKAPTRPSNLKIISK